MMICESVDSIIVRINDGMLIVFNCTDDLFHHGRRCAVIESPEMQHRGTGDPCPIVKKTVDACPVISDGSVGVRSRAGEIPHCAAQTKANDPNFTTAFRTGAQSGNGGLHISNAGLIIEALVKRLGLSEILQRVLCGAYLECIKSLTDW